MVNKEALQTRAISKRKKPLFLRQDAFKRKRLKKLWRRPRGSDSKTRLRVRGQEARPEVGWGSPRAVKGCDKSGFLPMVVNSVDDLLKIDAKTQGAVIASTVGTKKKIAILEQATSKKIRILNVKESEKAAAKLKEQFENKKKEKQKIKDDREKKKETAKKEAEKKKSKDDKKEEKKEELTDEQKKEEEKKEKDKLLISTQ